MRDALLAWFVRHGRPLPWRPYVAGRTPSPPGDPVAEALRRDRTYVVWIVEAMSQQTRIETVRVRLPAFLERFPDLRRLAAAELDEVLAAWAGLGYYRRARALHAAARSVAAAPGSGWPTTLAGWRALPGVGPYTAAAVAAQAQGAGLVAVDANVRRVGARVLAHGRPTDAQVSASLAALLGVGPTPAGAPSVAEALVELGALVCTARAPGCAACPLRPGCAAAAGGDPEGFPAARARPVRRDIDLHGWVVLRPGPGGHAEPTWELALERRPDDGLWGGLHGLPWRPRPPEAGAEVGRFEHALTHRLVHAVVWRCAAPPDPAGTRWRALSRLAEVGIAEIDRRALALALDRRAPTPALDRPGPER